MSSKTGDVGCFSATISEKRLKHFRFPQQGLSCRTVPALDSSLEPARRRGEVARDLASGSRDATKVEIMGDPKIRLVMRII